MAERRPASSLAANGGLGFFVATLAYNGGNFVFHMVMSRMLGPDRYGALGSLLGYVTVAVLPVSALQAAVTQSVAERRSARHHPARQAGGLSRPLRRTALAAAVVMVLLLAVSPWADRFVDVGSPLPLLLLGTYVATSVCTIVPQGVLIGRLQFRPVAAALVAGSVVRLASGVGLVGAGFGLDGAAAASALAGIATLVVVVWPLRGELGLGGAAGRRTDAALPAAVPVGDDEPLIPDLPSVAQRVDRPRDSIELRAGPAMLAVVALAGVSAFLGVDSVLARHFLSRVDAGYYVAASTAARVALFLPGAVAMTAFPRLAAARGAHHEVRRLLLEALGLTAVLSGGAAAVIAAFPHLFIAVLFGSAYQSAAGPLAILSAAAAAMGLASVLVYFFLAERSVLATGCWVAVVALAGLVVALHRGLDTIAWLTLAVTGSMTVVMGTVALGRRPPAHFEAMGATDGRLGLPGTPVGAALAGAEAALAHPPGAEAARAHPPGVADGVRNGAEPARTSDRTARTGDRPARNGDRSARPGDERPALERPPSVDVTIVVPYFNVGDRVRPTIDALLATLRPSVGTFEVVAVSDGSGDGAHLSLAGLPTDEVRSVVLPRHQGKGAALRAGMAAARGRYVGFIDGDGDLPPEQLADVLGVLRQQAPDVVVGSKRHPGSAVASPATRRLASWGWQRAVGLLFRLPVCDTQTGLKLVRRDVLAAALPRTAVTGFAFDLELLVVAQRLGFRDVLEVPVRIRQRAGTTVSPRAAACMVRDLFAVAYRLRVHRYDEGAPVDGRGVAVDGVAVEQAAV